MSPRENDSGRAAHSGLGSKLVALRTRHNRTLGIWNVGRQGDKDSCSEGKSAAGRRPGRIPLRARLLIAEIRPPNSPTHPHPLHSAPFVPAQVVPLGNSVYTKQLPNMCSQSSQSRKEREPRLLTLNLQPPPSHTHTRLRWPPTPLLCSLSRTWHPFLSQGPPWRPLPPPLFSFLSCYCSQRPPTLSHFWILLPLFHPS